ncbi:indole-3-acetic acid inducible 32, partial [Striga asiatica]
KERRGNHRSERRCCLKKKHNLFPLKVRSAEVANNSDCENEKHRTPMKPISISGINHKHCISKFPQLENLSNSASVPQLKSLQLKEHLGCPFPLGLVLILRHLHFRHQKHHNYHKSNHQAHRAFHDGHNRERFSYLKINVENLVIALVTVIDTIISNRICRVKRQEGDFLTTVENNFDICNFSREAKSSCTESL